MRPPRPRSRGTAGRIAAAVTSIVVVGVVFVAALPQIADYGAVAASLRALPPWGLALLVVLTVVHLGAFALVLATVLPGLRRRQALAVHLASTAVAHTVPAGGAVAVGVQYASLGVLGHPAGVVTPGLAAAGLWDNGGRLLLLAAGAGLIAVGGDPVSGALGATGFVLLLALVALVAAALTSDRLLRLVAHVLNRPLAFLWRLRGRVPLDVQATLTAIRRGIAGIARVHWRRLTVLTLLYHLALLALLLACLRLLGVDAGAVTWMQVLPVYALARVVTAMPVTPGGVGIVELGYVALLAGDAPEEVAATVTAAVLLFRALSYLLPILLGAASWLLLPRLRERSRLQGPVVG